MENEKTKIIHCDTLVKCEKPSLNSHLEESLNEETFKHIFMDGFNLGYILDTAKNYGFHFHIVEHAVRTSTCQEKAGITGLKLEEVMKGIYLEDTKEKKTYALSIPGNKKWNVYKVASFLGIDKKEAKKRIRYARESFLPVGIEYGTVHPFVNIESLSPQGKLECILFDKNYIDEVRYKNNVYNDFSFTLPHEMGYDNHKISVQMSAWHAFIILSETFGYKVRKADIASINA